MKKIGILLLTVLITFTGINVNAEELPEVTDHEKVNIYFFWGLTCGYCSEAIDEFLEVEDKYEDYLEIHALEIYGNEDNSDLFMKVFGEFDPNEDSAGVPYIVVGDDYSTIGYGDGLIDSVIEEALEQYQDEDYYDKVADIAKNEDFWASTVEEALEGKNTGVTPGGGTNNGTDNNDEDNLSTSEEDGNVTDAIVVTLIFVVVIGGSFLLILSPSTKKSVKEVKTDEVKLVEKEEPVKVAEIKKTSTKKKSSTTKTNTKPKTNNSSKKKTTTTKKNSGVKKTNTKTKK